MNEAQSLPAFYEALRRLGELRSAAAIALVVAALLLLMIPPNGVLNDNEEHYFAAARQFFGAENVPPQTALMGGIPHAFAFYFVVGGLLEIASYEATQVVGRLLAIALYAVAITRLFRALALSALDAALTLAVFYLAGQQLMGEEWLFRGLEPKILAYPAVFMALTEIVRGGRPLRAFLWLAAATYFHFLVGAVWAALLGVTLLLNGRSFRELAACAAWYTAAVAPLLAFLLWHDYGGASVQQDSGLPSVGWIISYFRSVHHASPFASLSTFMAWSPGILATLVILAAAFPLARRAEGAARLLAVLLCVATVYLLLATLVSAFDRTGVLGPFTIFRPSSLTLFLALTLAMHWLAQHVEPATPVKLAGLGAALAVTAPALASGALDPVREQHRMRAQLEPVYEYAASSSPNDVFMIAPSMERTLLPFERRTGRALLVMNKFVPSSPDGILEWYRRRLFQNETFANGCKADAPYRVNFLIAEPSAARTLAATCGPIVFEHEGAAIVRNDSAIAPSASGDSHSAAPAAPSGQ